VILDHWSSCDTKEIKASGVAPFSTPSGKGRLSGIEKAAKKAAVMYT
jgi:hypothetical protein